MEYRILGKTGLKISRLAIGGIPFQRVTQKDVTNFLAEAHSLGLNFIDSARGYSVSEEYIGQALVSLRKEFVLATKSMVRTKEAMLKDIHISLNNFKTDYIDLYQIHNIRTEAEWETAFGPEGALEALQQAQKEGLIGHIGITGHSPEIVSKALETGYFSTMMFPYNVIENKNKGLFAKAAGLDIGTLAMKPLAGGFIAQPGPALRYLAADSNVDCLLVGMSGVEELNDDINYLAEGPLSPEAVKDLEDKAILEGQDFCRRCGYCLPCPQGIDIPSVFLLEGYYDRYELQGWARGRYAALPVNASACKACGKCLERCPYHLQIPDKLIKARAKLG